MGKIERGSQEMNLRNIPPSEPTSGDNKKSRDFVDMRSVIIEKFKEIETLYHNKSYITGIPTGFRDMDRLTAGFHRGDLIVIAAPSGMGKTVFALNIAASVAVEEKTPVGIISPGMSKEQIGDCIIHSLAMIGIQKVKNDTLKPHEQEKLFQETIKLAGAPLYIDDTRKLTIEKIKSIAGKMKQDNNIRLLIIDYFQLIRSHSEVSRNEQMAEISRELKMLARELNIPVIVLSQLNVNVTNTSNKKSAVCDLCKLGAIGEDGDLVAFIYRDNYYYPDNDGLDIAQIIVVKQRSGPMGFAELIFMKDCLKFLARDYYF